MARVRHKRRDALVLYPHHRKPYRVHHLASLLIALALVFACIFELGVITGNDQRAPTPPPPVPASKTAITPPTVVRSAYGFSFTADSANFTVSGTELGSGGSISTVTGSALKASRPLTAAVVKGRPGALSGRLAATQFSVRINPDQVALTAAEKLPANTGQTPVKVAATLFPVTGGSQVSVRTVSSAAAMLNNMPTQKTVYEFTSKQGGKSYAIQWSGVSKGRAFSVELDGLVGSGSVPGEFAAVLDSFNISADQAVLGADTIFAAPTASGKNTLDSKYLSDALSPAVVQIFHTVCGVLTVDGNALGSSDCISFSGSGFLASQSGYIATNGHVVVYTAKDALVDLITSNDAVLQAYLKGVGLTATQIKATESDPAALAALISKIYDLPDSQLHFTRAGELTLVALGDDQPDVKKLVKIRTSAQLAQFGKDTDTIKQAKVLAYNYNPKDSLTAIANPTAGFSSSDVALLKINVNSAPAIPIETGQVVQNEKIVIMGFPGDANNPLTDNQQTDVTVTDGVVSSIREAAGGHGRLYQSDADASHGSSGGPAIDEDGKVVGLMTYRYADSSTGDAAKSYIRDITDFTKLADDNGVKIDSSSTTQQEWAKGLELYSRSHYSAALQDFNKVEAAYPAQRLVSSYISNSKEAIASGQDVKDVPVGAIIIVLVVAITAAGATMVVIIRHHALHRVYRTSVPGAVNSQPVYMAKPPAASTVIAPDGASAPTQPIQPPDNQDKVKSG